MVGLRAKFGDFSVEVNDIVATRTLVEVVDVLGDDLGVREYLLQACNGIMCCIGLSCKGFAAAHVVELYTELRIVEPCIVGAYIFYAVTIPHAVRATKST